MTKLSTAGWGNLTALASRTPTAVRNGTPLPRPAHAKNASSISRATAPDGVEGKNEKKRSAWTKRCVSQVTVSGGGRGEVGEDDAAQRVPMDASSIS